MRPWSFALPALAYPAIAAAPDPTGLFVLLIGIPAVTLAILFTVLAFPAPKAARVLLVLLLVAHFPVLWWAADVGYMRSAGVWLFLSLAISVAGLFLAWTRIEKQQSAPLPLLFSYGTLQQAAVQSSIFGRLLAGAPDELVGFEHKRIATTLASGKQAWVYACA